MDNNRLDQLMNDGWKKLSVTLDAELPQKKERKYLFIWIIFSGLLITAFGFYFFKTSYSSIFDHIETNPKDNSNFITNQSGQTQPNRSDDKINNNEDKTKYIPAFDSEIAKSPNIIETNSEAASHVKTTRLLKEEQTLSNNSIMSFSKANLALNNNEIALANNQDIKDPSSKQEKNDSNVNSESIANNLSSKIIQLSEDKSQNFAANLPFSFKFPLVTMGMNQRSLDIIPQTSSKFRLFTFGIKATTSFSAFDLPTNYKVGVYGQRSLSKRWFSELSISFQKYNQYQVIYHNGQNFNNILYQDIQLQSGAPSSRALNSVYVSNSKNLTINQLGVIDESILSSSLNSMDLINAEVGAGYRFRNRLSMFVSLNLAKRINTSYVINNTNTTLFNDYNNKPIEQSNLKHGDQLLRKWIYGGAGGLEYKLSEKMALRSQIHFIPTVHSSQLLNNEFTDKSTSSAVTFDINSFLSENQLPKKGNMSLEFGFLWRLK